MEYSVTNANTWQQVTLTVTGGLTTAGTWDYTTGIGLAVSFCMMGGSTFQTTANAWQTGNFLATANQVNVMDTVGNVFKITAVQLYLGTFCPTYEERLYAGELQQCQRYYFVGQGGEVGARYASVAGTWNATTIRFPTTMRIAPLVTPSAFTYSNCSAGAASAIKTDGFSMSVSTSGTATYGLTAFTFACDAEIT